jgi:hypothetical protein
LTFHVTSPRDGIKLGDQETCLPILDEFVARLSAGYGDPYDTVVTARHRQIVIRQVADFLAQVHVAPVDDLLDWCLRLGTSATRQFIYGLGMSKKTAVPDRFAQILTRTHEDLALSYRDTGEGVALGVETSRGWVREIAVSNDAGEAIAFCTRVPTFNVRELPGNLSTEEQLGIAVALEDSGLFRNVGG